MIKMRSGFILALGLATWLPGVVNAQQYDGSYYCAAENSAGLAYNQVLKRWESTKFQPSEKFVVYFKFAGPHIAYGQASGTHDYFVTITPSGSDKKQACKTYYEGASDRIEFTPDGVRGDCQTSLKRYIFSLKYKRFMATFESGAYVIGMDEKDSDTPSISAGTCTKIQ